MIKIENVDSWGWEHAIRGMRNPMNSWDRSDSRMCCDGGREDCVMENRNCPKPDGENGFICLGDNDLNLIVKLIKGGQPHRKFLRQIFVSVDITAPLYWWKEFDTYKVGTTANSCSTMHKIAAKVFELDDFSHEHLDIRTLELLENIIEALNDYRDLYVNYNANDFEVKGCPSKKDIWWQMIQLLPSSYNQKRTVTMTYENLLNMVEYRRGHKLDEWRQFCEWVFTLPGAYILEEGIKK